MSGEETVTDLRKFEEPFRLQSDDETTAHEATRFVDSLLQSVRQRDVPNNGHEKQQEDGDDGDRIRRQLRALHHQNCPGTHDADHCNQEGTEKQGPYSPPR